MCIRDRWWPVATRGGVGSKVVAMTVAVRNGDVGWRCGVGCHRPVSYTHLDVYKRQSQCSV